jgi:GT2 family glycosyltransferase
MMEPKIDSRAGAETSPAGTSAHGASAHGASPTIAVVAITHSRVGVLRRCVENVLLRTSPSTTEIVIWNNASTDGTREYLDSLTDPRITVVNHPKNIGTNAYAKGFELTSASYLVDLDDDVTDAPPEWDLMLLDAFERIPKVGFLAADLKEDERDIASRLRHEGRADQYREEMVNGVRILDGPTGGACAMTSRKVYEEAGGFPQHKRKTFFLEDAAYIARIERLGYRKAILADLRVHHTGDLYHHEAAPAKLEYWHAHWRAAKRRNDVKRVLLRIPFVPSLNERLGLFGPLEWEKIPEQEVRPRT